MQELQQRIDGIEERYEFRLAYAAQGAATDVGSGSGAQLRELLRRTETALEQLADLFAAAVSETGSEPMGKYLAFVEVIREDSRKAQAAVGLTLAQSAISSQLIDNLNASIHLRALLTDVFLLDEIISPRSAPSGAAR